MNTPHDINEQPAQSGGALNGHVMTDDEIFDHNLILVANMMRTKMAIKLKTPLRIAETRTEVVEVIPAWMIGSAAVQEPRVH